MGYSKQGEITNFEPDNTSDTLYINSNYTSYSLAEIIEMIKEHFGSCDLNQFDISAQYIHTQCIYYDKYDAGDYTKYIVIRKISYQYSSEQEI